MTPAVALDNCCTCTGTTALYVLNTYSFNYSVLTTLIHVGKSKHTCNIHVHVTQRDMSLRKLIMLYVNMISHHSCSFE